CFYCHHDLPDLHSFPTRRSSDLNYAVSRIALWMRSAATASQVQINGALWFSPMDSKLPVWAGSASLAVPETPGFLCAVGYDGKRSEEHTSELQSRRDLVCRLLLE